MEQRLAQAQEQILAQERQAIVAELAGAAAHELNQPLTSVMGYAELLKRRLEPETAGLLRRPRSSSTRPSAWRRSSARSARSPSTRRRATSAARASSTSTARRRRRRRRRSTSADAGEEKTRQSPTIPAARGGGQAKAAMRKGPDARGEDGGGATRRARSPSRAGIRRRGLVRRARASPSVVPGRAGSTGSSSRPSSSRSSRAASRAVVDGDGRRARGDPAATTRSARASCPEPGRAATRAGRRHAPARAATERRAGHRSDAPLPRARRTSTSPVLPEHDGVDAPRRLGRGRRSIADDVGRRASARPRRGGARAARPARHARTHRGTGTAQRRRARFEERMVQADKLATFGQIAAGVVHELNNPLTSIVAYSDYLIRKARLGTRRTQDAGRHRPAASHQRVRQPHAPLHARPRRATRARRASVAGAGRCSHDVIDQAIAFCEHVLAAARRSGRQRYSPRRPRGARRERAARPGLREPADERVAGGSRARTGRHRQHRRSLERAQAAGASSSSSRTTAAASPPSTCLTSSRRSSRPRATDTAPASASRS